MLQPSPALWRGAVPYFRDICHIVPPSMVAQSSLRSYRLALRQFAEWLKAEGDPPITRATVAAWKAALLQRRLSAHYVNINLTMIRALVREASLQGLIPLDTATGILAIKGLPIRGQVRGRWLEPEELARLIAAPGTGTLLGLRDTAMLAVMGGAGLRRKEVASLRRRQVRQVEERWVLADLVSKGGRVRTVPLSEWVRERLLAWLHVGPTRGPVFYQLQYGATGYEPLTPQGIYLAVLRHRRRVGIECRPHDLRRTFAQLAYRGGAPLEQIQLVLGHASIQTTERYLGLGLDLENSAGDYIQLRF